MFKKLKLFNCCFSLFIVSSITSQTKPHHVIPSNDILVIDCLLYTSDAADD